MKHFVVGTMGKVGTTTLQRSLQIVPDIRAYKTHRLRVAPLHRLIERRKRDEGVKLDWAVQSRNFLRHTGLHGDDTILVTPVREIVGRNISGFFQRLRQFGITPPYEDVDVATVIEQFKHEFNHDRPDNWFKNEFEKAVKISLDEVDFDADKGYFLGKLKKVNVLLLQIELGDDVIAKLFNEKFGINLVMNRFNDSKNKKYAELISRFKERFVLDDELRDQLMNTIYMQKFYSQKQRDHIAAFYRKEVPSLMPLPR